MKRNRLKKTIFKLVSERNILTIAMLYFLIGYIYPNELVKIGLYNNLKEYLGKYEFILVAVIMLYTFSLYMQNRTKKIVLRTRLVALLIATVSYGYLKLLQLSESVGFENLQNTVMIDGLLNDRVGYVNIYLFSKIYPNTNSKIMKITIYVLLIFTLIVIFGKTIRSIVILIDKGIELIYVKLKRNEEEDDISFEISEEKRDTRDDGIQFEDSDGRDRGSE